MGIVEQNIKEFVEERGATLGWLAEKIGMSKSGFYKMIETGSIKVEVLQSIAEVLEKPISAFFTMIKVGDKRFEELGDKTVANLGMYILFSSVINTFKELKNDIEEGVGNDKLLKKVSDNIKSFEEIHNGLFDVFNKDITTTKKTKPNQ